ncbi:MAG: fatty acid desaturase [Steroidobacteraceae bacterium]
MPSAPGRGTRGHPRLIWTNALVFGLTALVAAAGVPWYGLAVGFKATSWVWFALFLVANGTAITGGYHRLWSHRAYDAHWTVRLWFMAFGSMAMQNSVLIWSSNHRMHHRFVDDTGKDPYASPRGFWFSHIGWMLRAYPSGAADLAVVRDLERDPILRFQHRFYLPLVLATNIGFPLLAGWAAGDVFGTFLLAGVLRLVLSHHFTFFINSLAHMWGTQPYTEENTARDNPVLALLTHGEGYHNFHHIFAQDYRNAIRWYQWDPTKWLVATLAALRLAWNLKRTPEFQIQRALLTMQFKRAEMRLTSLASARQFGTTQLEHLRARVSAEYEAFAAAVAEWARIKDQWYEEKKQAIRRRWEDTGLHRRLAEIERELRLQSKRLRLLQASLA